MKSTEEILELNKKQKDFYNSDSKTKTNLVSRLWFGFRNGILSDYRSKFDIKDKVYDQHIKWLGDLGNKKVLDLGCLRGNALSLHMAKNAREYIGIDLSDVAIASLQKRIEQEGCKNAKTIAIDFLSPEFEDKDFDIIYAYGVLHHFENFDLLISKLNEKLAPGGLVISYDPLETSTPVKLLRTIYRPFQSDKDWEWPFSKKVLQKIATNFKIEAMHGILGQSKYGIILNVLPVSSDYKSRVISGQIKRDWEIQKLSDLHTCMHATMLLRKL